MLIQTAKQTQTKRQPNKLAALDQQLAAGTLPAETYVRAGDNPGVFNTPESDTVALSDGSREVKSARRRSHIANLTLAPVMMMPGALLGWMATPAVPMVGAAVGAGIGLAMAIDSGREYRGNVKVDHDGEQSQRKWHGSPGTYQKSPEELRTILHATGVLGDHIPAVNLPKLEGKADPALLAQIAPHKDTLSELAGQRRLLADFGTESRYGKASVQIVDASMARQLLARGKSVQVVSVGKVEDTNHTFSSEAKSGTHHKKRVESFQYLERNLAYKLQTIDSPEQLAKVKDGKGLPESTLGVPSQEQTFSHTVFQREESGQRTIGKDSDSTEQSLREALTGGVSKPTAGRAGSALKSMVDPSTRGYTIAGGIIGTAAGAAIPGIEPSVGLTLGAFAGHFIGRAAVARTSENHQSSGVAKKVAIGAGVVAGLGLGILAAAQTGNAGIVGGGVIGGVGGLCTGVLALRSNPKAATNAGMAGFCAGSMVGIFGTAMGAGPVTTVALGALGAVAGGTIGHLAMRGK